MKKLIFTLIGIIFISFFGCQSNDVNVKSDVEKPTQIWDQFSYIVGNTVGENLKRDSVYNLNFKYFLAAIKRQLENKEPLLTRQEMDSIIQIINIELQARSKRVQIREQIEATKNKEKAIKFLEENKKKPNVIVTETGLQYEILKQGSGSSPRPLDHCKIQVIGKHIDGKEFDNSIKKGKPYFIHLDSSKVMPSWYQALKQMKVGSKWKIYAPPELTFGTNIPPNLGIKPNELLIFEIELLDFSPEPFEGEQVPPSSVSPTEIDLKDKMTK